MGQIASDPARDYLNSVLEARMEAKRLQHKVAQLEAQATKTTTIITGMPRGGNADRDAVLAALADVTSDYSEKIVKAERLEKEVNEFIDSLPTRDCRMLLRLRYLEGMSWRKVLSTLKAHGIHLSERQMYRLHGTALNEAREGYVNERL